jgi:hypothetical protein
MWSLHRFEAPWKLVRSQQAAPICPDGGMVDTGDLKSPDFSRAGSSPAPGTRQVASADGAVPGLLNQVMGVRISPEAPLHTIK